MLRSVAACSGSLPFHDDGRTGEQHVQLDAAGCPVGTSSQLPERVVPHIGAFNHSPLPGSDPCPCLLGSYRSLHIKLVESSVASDCVIATIKVDSGVNGEIEPEREI